MRLLATALILALTSAACTSGSDVTGTSSPKPLANGSMRATIDGTAWSATPSVTASNRGGVIGVGGTDATQTIAFALAANVPGTYVLGPLNPANCELTTTGGVVWTAAGNVGSGTITITSLTATDVAGTFSFTLVRAGGGASKTVTNGAFDIKL